MVFQFLIHPDGSLKKKQNKDRGDERSATQQQPDPYSTACHLKLFLAWIRFNTRERLFLGINERNSTTALDHTCTVVYQHDRQCTVMPGQSWRPCDQYYIWGRAKSRQPATRCRHIVYFQFDYLSQRRLLYCCQQQHCMFFRFMAYRIAGPYAQ